MARRRQYPPEFKLKVVLEFLQGQKSQAQICREHNIADELLSRWRQEFLARAPEIFAVGRSRSAEQERIAELERLVGQLSLELNAVRKGYVPTSRENSAE